MNDFGYITACTASEQKGWIQNYLLVFLKTFRPCFCGHPLCTANAKKEIPEENDTLDVLENIAKNGAPLRKLNVCGINTVKELLLFYEKHPQALREVSRSMQFVFIFSED
jgi:hypothetical protein